MATLSDDTPQSPPNQQFDDGVLRPPPLQSFRPDDHSDRSNLNFTLRITEKLSEKNFHLWRQQVEPYINAHDLDEFLRPSAIPPRFLNNDDRAAAILNPAFRKWRQRDQMLLSWLQSTLTSDILARFLGANHTFELWGKIVSYFQKQLRAKARQLRVELRATTLENSTVQEYLLRIRLIVDNLASIGDPIPLNQHLDVILEGLPPEFNSVISVVESRFDSIDMDEVEALLLAHEARLQKSKKKTIDDAASINIAQQTNTETTPPDPPLAPQPSVNNSQGSKSNYHPYANATRGRGGRNGRGRGKAMGGRTNTTGNVQCQICFKGNHTALDCWHRHDQQYQGQNPQNTQNVPQAPPQGYFQEAYGPFSGQNFPPGFGRNYGFVLPNYNAFRPPAAFNLPPTAMLANGSSSNPTAAWYPDSGASFHVTADARNIQEQSPFTTTDQIFMGNGQSLSILSNGSSVFTPPNHTQTQLTLNNLLHVPSITKNLISVSQFARDNDVFFEFHPDHCVVKSQATREILLQGNVGADGLYCFSNISLIPAKSSRLSSVSNPSVCSIVSNSSNNNSSLSFNSLYLWHLRLGHPNSQTLKLALKLCNISVSNNTNDVSDFCTACCMGKAHRLHSPQSQTTYSQPLELVFSDLWGPAPSTSSSGYNYYITFIDAYSRYTWIYLIKSKSEALTIFKQFKHMAELQLGHSLKALQSDWGGEFRPFTKYLSELGIIHRLICPHTHHQNGVVERKHRHVVDMGLTLLSQSNLPLHYWDHAFLTAVHLINRLPTASLNFKIPYTVLFQKEPDYTFFKTFGCACFPLLRPYNTYKFDFRSHECIFLGYSNTHKGYKCLSPNGRIFVSKDVLFNEARFPYPLLFPNTNRNSTSPIPNVPISTLPTGNPNLHQIPATTTTTLTDLTNNTIQNTITTEASPTPPDLTHSSENITSNNSNTDSSAINNSPTNLPTLTRAENTHPMKTRAKSGIVLPRQNPKLLLSHTEPKTVRQALIDLKWHNAMKEEYEALQKNQTWTLVPLPQHRQAIGCKWVFRTK
jgi:histone deacetylase 1/2